MVLILERYETNLAIFIDDLFTKLIIIVNLFGNNIVKEITKIN